MKNLLETADLSPEVLNDLLSEASQIYAHPEKYFGRATGKILATLFYEPSTRTRLSFESAMLRLGGTVIGFSDASFSSVRKGETPEDTAIIVSGYCDIMTVRHPIAFTQWRMAKVATVPLINAGDGANEHPTQTLTDVFTLSEKFGRLDHLTIGLCGDLKYGRTVHSLVKVLSMYPGNRFYFIAPDLLQMPKEILEQLAQANIPYTCVESISTCGKDLDVLYMTRIQKERFEDPEDFKKLGEHFILDEEALDSLKEDMIILHPLPRVDEIPESVDSDPRAWYFKQARLGLYVRMALILSLLEDNK